MHLNLNSSQNAPRRLRTKKPKQVYIVEDHARLRHQIVSLVNTLPNLTVIGQAASGTEALADPFLRQVDLILTDLTMPDLNGIAFTQKLKLVIPATPVIILTGHSDSYFAREAFEAGASAYIVKDDPEIIEAIVWKVLQGETGIVALA